LWVKCRWFRGFDDWVNAVLGALMIGSSAGGLGGLMIGSTLVVWGCWCWRGALFYGLSHLLVKRGIRAFTG
jgi:hypothetical protein